MNKALFLRPLDVLYLRGNKLFGASGGDDAGAQMPPWPSVVAGAIRSRMLVDGGENPADFARDKAPDDPALAKSLGTPEKPGDFRLARFCLARRDGAGVEPLLPLPTDWLATGSKEKPKLHRLAPAPLPEGVKSSAATEAVPVLCIDKQAKPLSGFFLTGEGLAAWLRDDALSSAHLIHTEALWKNDPRLGIGMDTIKRTAGDGRIYTSDAVALTDGVGFLAEVSGADGLLPRSGLVRLGGDGRGAEVSIADVAWPEPDWNAIERTGRFRLMLTSPGLFEAGWRPPLEGARLIAAAVNRAETVSGWDVAIRAPKPAECAAPAGCVYWFEGFNGDVDGLRRLVRDGLPCPDAARCAEGFNACLIGNWNKERSDV